MKGIILAGGTGSRLFPITKTISKQMVPVYDKPMIYYPLSVLMSAGITEIMIICNMKDLESFNGLFGDGSKLGISIRYQIQMKPEGIAQAFVLAEHFIQNDPVCLILGDNIFFGSGFDDTVKECTKLKDGGLIFGYPVNFPEQYGVIEFNGDKPICIREKPHNPQSNYAVPGLYFYDKDVVEVAKMLRKSPRGEYEITDINNYYMNLGQLEVKILERGICWLDTGTFETLQQACNYVQAIQERQGLKIGCIEEIAYKLRYINKSELLELAKPMLKNEYGKYLQKLTTY